MSQVKALDEPSGTIASFEELLVREGAVTDKQLSRARRIASRLDKAQPLGAVLIELGQLTRAEHDRVRTLHRSRLSLVEILKEDGALTEAQTAEYEQVRPLQPESSDRQLLVEEGRVTEEQFLQALSAKHNIPYVEPEVSLIDTSLLAKTSIPFLRRERVVPLRIIDGSLHAILADPVDEVLIQQLEQIFGVRVQPSCAPLQAILDVLGALDHLRDATPDDRIVDLQYEEIEDAAAEDSGEGAVRVVDYLISKAIQLGASDLHIEPMEKKIRVRVRVDGILRQITDLPVEFAPRIASRIKILGGADIAERRLHQDGRIFVRMGGHEVDIRVSSYASMFGENLVMRVLDRQKGLVPMDGLGFQPGVLTVMLEVVLRASAGLVLVTGPTGSGKTTTLYSFIDYIKDETQKVITCEDPVEYVLEGVVQCSVNEKTGPTFHDSLRAIVRQDPDIIVVGEVRNRVTAELAVESALTGHKVFSTFHTEDSVGAVVRLLEMGVEPFLIASTLCCVVGQRLLRKLCSNCQAPAEPSKKDLRFLGLERKDLQGIPLREGAGCPDCEGSGYKDRIGVHEVLWPNEAFKDAILSRASSSELRALARQLPAFLTLQEDGLLKVVEGKTTLSEVVDNVPRDAKARRIDELREVASSRRLS